MSDILPLKRVRPLHLVVAAAILVIGGGIGWWLFDHAGVIVTSDARVRARMVTISSEVAGRIEQLPVEAGDRVTAGQVLVRLDDREAKLTLAAAVLELKALEAQIERERLHASLARARGASRVDGRRSGLVAANADVAAAGALLETAEADFERTRTLRASGLVTQPAMDRASTALEAARQAAARAGASVGESEAGGGEAEAEAGEARVIERNIEALSLQAHALRQRISLQKVELEEHVIESPLAGVIDEVFAEAGEHVAPGARIALAHADEDLWIEANIKETELAGIRVDAGVEIRLDASDEVCVGKVERIGAAATSEFALIPNANPTGVFTKITQRVPVRISIGACGGARPGAMATLKIRAQ